MRKKRVTELNISLPAVNASPVAKLAGRCELVSLRTKEPHHMEIGLNGRKAGQAQDLRPELPLTVYW